ncbi:MAG TPA: fibronectin type III-like domain-contianing protein, partial [Cytophagaceae bacterium]
RYKEGVFVGYRYYDKNNVTPLFPFGHGLSYTTFKYSDILVKKLADGSAQVTFDITNTGKSLGTETVQLYVRDKVSKVERPDKELKKFSKVTLKPGEKTKVTYQINNSDLSFYDVSQSKWLVESGDFDILVGSSSRDIRLTGLLNIP